MLQGDRSSASQTAFSEQLGSLPGFPPRACRHIYLAHVLVATNLLVNGDGRNPRPKQQGTVSTLTNKQTPSRTLGPHSF